MSGRNTHYNLDVEFQNLVRSDPTSEEDFLLLFLGETFLKEWRPADMWLKLKQLQAGSDDHMRQAQIFLYANGNDHPPTAIDLDKSLLKDLLFNHSPSKVRLWCFFSYYIGM